MKRSVQFFIQKGRVTKVAEPFQDKSNFGTIEVLNLANPQDTKNLMTVYTHFRHSFIRENGQPKQFDKGAVVYFFLVPMEYLFSEINLPASEDTPFLAVNVNVKYPFIVALKGDKSVTKHPCTTGTTVVGDTGTNQGSKELEMSIFLLNPMILNNLFPVGIPKDKNWFYGINDYGEFTIIETDKNKTIEPWDKILLQPFKKKNEKFFREYSPKLPNKVEDNVEFQILKQSFLDIDDGWKWITDSDIADFPPYKP